MIGLISQPLRANKRGIKLMIYISVDNFYKTMEYVIFPSGFDSAWKEADSEPLRN